MPRPKDVTRSLADEQSVFGEVWWGEARLGLVRFGLVRCGAVWKSLGEFSEGFLCVGTLL